MEEKRMKNLISTLKFKNLNKIILIQQMSKNSVEIVAKQNEHKPYSLKAKTCCEDMFKKKKKVVSLLLFFIRYYTVIK